MKYLVRVDHWCNLIETGGVWIIVEAEREQEPKIGDTGKFTEKLPTHDCKRYYSDQLCEEEENCTKQAIVEVRDYTDEEAGRLCLINPDRNRRAANTFSQLAALLA